MSEMAHACAAIWDGASGGTKDAFEKALARELPTAIFNLRTKKIDWRNF